MKIRIVLVACAALVLKASFLKAQATQQPVPKPKPDSVVAPPKRRALEIRGQAPAPEVVTVRPREIPPYTRRIITPMLDSATARRPTQPVIIPKPE